jgi:hypothetical protein
MTGTSAQQIYSSSEMERDQIIQLLNRALSSGNFRFIQKLCKQWLDKYPNDISVQCFLIRASLFDEDQHINIELINALYQRDPENMMTWELPLKANLRHKNDEIAFIKTNLFVLGKEIPDSDILGWGRSLREIRLGLIQKSISPNDKYFQSLSKENPETPLIGIYHLAFAKINQEPKSFHDLVKTYHKRWPDCIAINLWFADSLMELGHETEAVSLLHKCAAEDPGGEVIRRLWGDQHDYLAMWPAKLTIQLTIPIPTQIGVPMGWNQLLSGESQKSDQELLEKRPTIYSFKKIFKLPKKKDDIDSKQLDKNKIPGLSIPGDDFEKDLNDIVKKNETFSKQAVKEKIPVFVILSTKAGLYRKYGEKSSSILFAELKKLSDLNNLKPGWQSIVFYPDDINCMRLFDLDPIQEIDPWKIKLALVDLDKYLGGKGQMIGSVLIVGGSDIVPFHSLPNPTDDKDKDVLSDNPYTTLDSNYFVPEWPLGRLPGENSKDPGLLLKQIRQVISDQQKSYRSNGWWQFLLNLIFKLSNPIELFKNAINKPSNYGYTASVWRRSSLAAFHPIGTGNHLRVTPPFESSTLDIDLLKKAKYAYFNLHGLPDSAEWYGQRDISEQTSGPDFPTAIAANQLSGGGTSPSIVFSEACYGAYIENKDSDDSMALRFKESGTSVFIGSTCISYGSINTPLIGADLLAFLFWKFLLDGFTAGEAFLRAKVSLAEVMMKRQGFLDGEDQKILLSFVYYGDPLARFSESKTMMKSILRSREIIKLKTITDHEGVENKENRLSGEVLNKIKNDLKEYLPGIDSAEVKIHPNQFSGENWKKEFGKSQASMHGLAGQVKISYYRPVVYQKTTHFQYARVTVDHEGKMVKLVVSR